MDNPWCACSDGMYKPFTITIYAEDTSDLSVIIAGKVCEEIYYGHVMRSTDSLACQLVVTSIEDFTATEAKAANTIWIVHAETGYMFKTQIHVATDKIITVQHHDNKIVFTYGYEHWRGRDYTLAISEG